MPNSYCYVRLYHLYVVMMPRSLDPQYEEMQLIHSWGGPVGGLAEPNIVDQLVIS